MTIMDTLNEKRISVYRLSKTSGVPYATVNDICNGKTRLEKCSAETIYRLAQALDVSMEELLTPYMVKLQKLGMSSGQGEGRYHFHH